MNKKIIAIVLLILIISAQFMTLYAKDEFANIKAKVVKLDKIEDVTQDEEASTTKRIQKVTIKILEGEYENEEYELDYLFLIKDKSRKMKEKSVRKLMNKDEVENVKFCSYDYLKHDLINRPNIYTPWFKFIMEKKGKKIFEVSENNGINYKYDGKIINLL